MQSRSVDPALAQPTSPAARTRSRLSAAGSVLAAIIAVLLPLALPEGSAAAASGSGAWSWPLLGEVITPYKNGIDPYAAGQHRGLDIAAPAGSPVLAIVDGRVSFSGRLPDGGETVTVASADGAWLVSDLHLSARAVTRGASVRAGDLLGRVGTTGRRSTEQPHLHLGVRRSDTRAYVDPMTLLGPPRLPAAPKASAEPAASTAQPAVPAARAPRQIRTTPLERGVRKHNVHAQSPGDASPATRHGAGSVATRNPAGAPAREGHAAEQATGRVAPPPLPAETIETRAPAGEARVASAAKTKKPHSDRGGANRILLLAMAAVCILALAVRRRPSPIKESPAPPRAELAADPPGEVIAIDRGRRSA